MAIRKFNIFTDEDDLLGRGVKEHTFSITDVAASGDTAANKDHDLLVLDSYEMVILRSAVSSNTARTAGTATVKITVDGTALTNGPESVLDATDTLVNEARVDPGSVVVSAGSVVSVLATGDASWTPITADFAINVYYYLNPVA